MAAGKEVRFAKLVEESGPPEVVTLWADPKKDETFMKLVRQGKILTVIQKPAGTKKDFGLIGFHPQPFAAYLSFPKRLKGSEEAVVVGIKYDLLKKSGGRVVGDSAQAPRLKMAKPEKPAPVRRLFEVTIQRRAVLKLKLSVEAFDAKEAKIQALAEVSAKEFSAPAEAAKNMVVAVRKGEGGVSAVGGQFRHRIVTQTKWLSGSSLL